MMRRMIYKYIVIIAVNVSLYFYRVSQLSDIDFIARETDCLPSFVRKGIAMSCFYYARCLHEGAGAKKDEAEAKRFYSRVRLCLVLIL